MLALSDGRYTDAERCADEALLLGRQAGDSDADAFFMVQLWGIRAEQGRLAELEPTVRALAERYAAIVAYRCRLGALYAELGRPREAAEHFEAALALAARLASPPQIEHTRTAAGRTGPAPAAPSPAARPALPDGLTVRELEILRLLAAGRTNAEI